MKFLVTADDTGSVKEVICNRGTDTSKKDGQQPKSITNYCGDPSSSYKNKITHLLDFHSVYLIGARVGGSVSVWEFTPEVASEEEPKYASLHTYKLDVAATDRPIALLQIDTLDSIIVAYESSKVFLIHFKGEGFEYAPIPIVLPSTKPLNAFIQHPNEAGIFAFGGQENDLQVVRLFEDNADSSVFEDEKVSFTPKPVFTAKNVKNDHLDLRVPVWISQILFMDAKPASGTGYKIVTATRYGQLRIYDTTHGRRPISDYKVTEKAIVSMVYGDQKQETVIITDIHSLIAKYSLVQIDEKAQKIHSASAGDVIKPVAKLLGKFSQGGNTGATHALQNCEDEVLVTGGLDRYLRVFDIVTRDILAKVYLGVEISSVIVLDMEDEEEEGEESKPVIQKKRRRDIEKAEESDDEELWSQLDKKRKED